MIDELETCILAILTVKESPETTLPKSVGFFFGSVENDFYYYIELIYTLTLTKVAKEALAINEIGYYSEWW